MHKIPRHLAPALDWEIIVIDGSRQHLAQQPAGITNAAAGREHGQRRGPASGLQQADGDIIVFSTDHRQVPLKPAIISPLLDNRADVTMR